MRQLMRIVVIALCCGLSVDARAADPTPEKAARALGSFEIPVTRERMEALGPGWERAVQALLKDPATRPILRPRAIAALGFSGTPDSAKALREVLAAQGSATEGAAVIETRVAVVSLAAVEGRAALAEVRRYLNHAVLDVRIAAADGLGHIGGAEARKALSARLPVEKDPQVLEALRGALGKLEAK